MFCFIVDVVGKGVFSLSGHHSYPNYVLEIQDCRNLELLHLGSIQVNVATPPSFTFYYLK